MHEGGAVVLDYVEQRVKHVLLEQCGEEVVVEVGVGGGAGNLGQIADEQYDKFEHLHVDLEPAVGRQMVVVRDVHHKDLETFLLDETFLVVSAAPHQLLSLLGQQLLAGSACQQRQQSDQPERQLLVLHLQHQQLQQITLDDIVVRKYEPSSRITRHVLPDKFDEIFNRLLAMRSFDIGLENAVLVLDGANSSQTLETENNFVFQFADLFVLVVVDHEFEIVLSAELASRPFELLDLLHFPLNYNKSSQTRELLINEGFI